MKKIVCLLMIFGLLFSCNNGPKADESKFDEHESVESGDFKYEVYFGVSSKALIDEQNGYAVLKGVVGSSTEKKSLEIPGTVVYSDNEYRVKTIDEGAFTLCGKLERLSIPASVKTIRKNALNVASLKDIMYGGTASDFVTMIKDGNVFASGAEDRVQITDSSGSTIKPSGTEVADSDKHRTGAGGIGTEITKGDMSNAQPMEMTNFEYFSIALSADVMKNVTMTSVDGDYNLKFEIESPDKFCLTMESNGESGKMYYGKLGNGSYKIYQTGPAFRPEEADKWMEKERSYFENGEDSGFGLFMEALAAGTAFVSSKKSDYTYDETTKKYHIGQPQSEPSSHSYVGSVYGDFEFAGNLLKSVSNSSLTATFKYNFGYYGTTHIENWPAES